MWTSELSQDQQDAVRALAGRACAADGVAPLNEAALLALRTKVTEHLLRLDGDRLVGYLQWQPRAATAQLVVDPDARRRGVGTGLAEALAAHAEEQLWAFGDTAAARGFADARGLVPVRTMRVLHRPLGDSDRRSPDATPGSVPSPAGPSARREPRPDWALRGFRPGDEAALLAVNAQAFAHHPEQAGLGRAGLAARLAEPWFDPDGLILAFDADGLVGFHWTKSRDADTGEVYVICVAPRAQGHGLGRRLLDAGLARLADAGHRRVVLYVDSEDQIAVQMYETAGFALEHLDVVYAPLAKETP